MGFFFHPTFPDLYHLFTNYIILINFSNLIKTGQQIQKPSHRLFLSNSKSSTYQKKTYNFRIGKGKTNKQRIQISSSNKSWEGEGQASWKALKQHFWHFGNYVSAALGSERYLRDYVGERQLMCTKNEKGKQVHNTHFFLLFAGSKRNSTYHMPLTVIVTNLWG